MGFPCLPVKNPPANAEDMGLIPESGRSPGEGNGNLLLYSCQENALDRRACAAMETQHSQTETNQLSYYCFEKNFVE